MSEIKNEIEVIDLENEVMDEVTTRSNGLKKGLVVGAAVVGVGVVAALAYKFRGKLKERKIRQLEKEGYLIYSPDEVIDEDSEDAYETEE